MTGEVGTGKTTLLKTVLSSFTKDRVSTAFVFNPRLDVLDFLEFVLTDFGIPPKTRTKSGMLLQLNRWLIERFRKQDCAPSWSTKRRISPGNFSKRFVCSPISRPHRRSCVQIVLSGQPELEEKLRDPCSPASSAHFDVVQNAPLSSEETQAYIAERLRIAGARQPVLTPEAVQLVHRYSKGIPRSSI
jgi:general secretion pathway protein A